MANIIATEKLAATIGGGTSYTANLMVTRLRAVALGCNIRNSYTDKLLVCHKDLWRCVCDTECSCTTTSCTCTDVCSCENACLCETFVDKKTSCTCHTAHCTCKTEFTITSCRGYNGSISSTIKSTTNCTSECTKTLECDKWCSANACESNTCSSYNYTSGTCTYEYQCLGKCDSYCAVTGTNTCKGECYKCECDTHCTCTTTECTCTSGNCSCESACTCESGNRNCNQY